MTSPGENGAGLPEELDRALREAGFCDAGFCGARRLSADLARLESWIAAGRHAEMEWLARRPARRGTPPGWARSVVVALDAYPPLAWLDGEDRHAAFADGTDYHVRLKAMMNPALALIERHGGRGAVHVDTGAVLEKAWAREAGLGFIGRNTLLVSNARGPYVLIALLFTDLEIPTLGRPVEDSCGACRLCVDACPGSALDDQGLDARRCLSWITIEKRNPTDEERRRARPWVHGCDECLAACPHAQRSLPARRPRGLAASRRDRSPGQTGSGS